MGYIPGGLSLPTPPWPPPGALIAKRGWRCAGKRRQREKIQRDTLMREKEREREKEK
jgi:hypothetical protein